MAAFTTAKLGADPYGGQIVIPTSVRSGWMTIHSDLTQAAETTALLRPATAGATYPLLTEIGNITRVMVRARYLQASTLTTNPVVRLIAVNGPDLATAGTLLDDGTYDFTRIDQTSGDFNGAGITLTIETSTDARDTTYRYTDPYDMTGFDLKGGRWLLGLTETAAVVSAGSVQLQVKPLN